jgi:hypothetical protein
MQHFARFARWRSWLMPHGVFELAYQRGSHFSSWSCFELHGWLERNLVVYRAPHCSPGRIPPLGLVDSHPRIGEPGASARCSILQSSGILSPDLLTRKGMMLFIAQRIGTSNVCPVGAFSRRTAV